MIQSSSPNSKVLLILSKYSFSIFVQESKLFHNKKQIMRKNKKIPSKKSPDKEKSSEKKLL